MLNITVICVGNLKEAYLRDAVKEYEKRLAAYCRFKTVELKDGAPKVNERVSINNMRLMGFIR